jgi:putative ABC transport system permease protein
VIRLGLRLARAGGEVRMASLVLGGALAVALLGLAWGLPDALYPRYEDPLEPGVWLSPPQRASTVAMSTLMLAPVLMLLIATGRMSSVVRDQRLVSLRLIGVSKARTLVAAVAENVSLTLVGAVGGLGLLRLGARIVDARLPVEQPFHLSPLQVVGLALAVVAVSGLLALASARVLTLLPTQARRGGVARQASWWQILPVVVATVCFGVVMAYGGANANAVAGFFVAGVAAGAIGIATAPALVARHSAALLRRSRRLSLLMAGRGIEADPTSATRRVAAVGVATFAILIIAGVMNAWESVPQSRHAVVNAERGPQEVLVIPGWTSDSGPHRIDEEDLAPLSAVPGATHLVVDHGLRAVGCAEGTGTGCVVVFVGSCAELAATLPVSGCSDEEAAWIGATGEGRSEEGDGQGRPQTLELASSWIDSADVEHLTEPFTVVPAPRPIELDRDEVRAWRGHPPDVELFVPARAVDGLDLPIHSVDVIGPPGRDFATAVGLVAEQRGLHAPVDRYYADYTILVSIRTMLGSAGAALVAVVLLVLTLSVLDWQRESRRPRMRLLAVGVPRGVIARTALVQLGIPLGGAILLGALLGGAGLRAYEVLGSDVEGVGTFTLPTTYWWLVGALVVGVLLAAALAGLAARERLRPADLRQE